MWLDLIKASEPQQSELGEHLLVGSRKVPLLMVRHSRARRYLLRLRPDGTARVTIPGRGSVAEARRFVERSRPWLEAQLQRLQTEPAHPAKWEIGSQIWFRGEFTAIEQETSCSIRIWNLTLAMPDVSRDLRPAIELNLRRLACVELPVRVLELATLHHIAIRRVTVRSQKSRWGSCSRKGTISLNWRLIQTPDFVRDYIILHELAHVRHMNHSGEFWREVERLCPGYREAERWLKTRRGFFI